MTHNLLSDNFKKLCEEAREKCGGHLRIMEVCGTHTMSIFKHAIRDLVPDTIELISGPGCPVCVTQAEVVENAIHAAMQKDTILVTFGDMLKVPGINGISLRECGGNVKMIFSPMDVLTIAEKNPDKTVVLLAVGFETTTAGYAVALRQAQEKGLTNLKTITSLKRVVPAIDALLSDPQCVIDGFILPGHVSVIIGTNPYEELLAKYPIPCAVAGFESDEILLSIQSIVRQIAEGSPKIDNCYKSVVTPEGNTKALGMIDNVFTVQDEKFRGIGVIPQAGYKLAEAYSDFAYPLDSYTDANEVCRCGEVLRGLIKPSECPFFGQDCNPLNPIGPCMVSFEGACGIYYRFSDRRDI